MEYQSIMAEHNDSICADINYNDSVSDYIVYCDLDFYGVNYGDDIDDNNKKIFLGSIKGYLILTHLMELMCEDVYTVCDNHSYELEMVMSIITKQGKREIDDDVFYIKEITVSDNVFKTVMMELPNVIMKHYHSYPGLIAYYPEPLSYKHEKSAVHKVKEDMAQIILRDIFKSDDEKQICNTVCDNDQDITVGLDDEQINYLLGRWNDYNIYPELAKNIKEFERFENIGFKEMGNTRLLFKFSIPDL